jgi:hypothetical protein
MTTLTIGAWGLKKAREERTSEWESMKEKRTSE